MPLNGCEGRVGGGSGTQRCPCFQWVVEPCAEMGNVSGALGLGVGEGMGDSYLLNYLKRLKYSSLCSDRSV